MIDVGNLLSVISAQGYTGSIQELGEAVRNAHVSRLVMQQMAKSLADPGMLDFISRESDPGVLLLVATNPATPEATLKRMMGHPKVRQAIQTRLAQKGVLIMRYYVPNQPESN